MERSGLVSSWLFKTSSQISTAFFGSLASRPFAFSLSCSSLDMERLRYRSRLGGTSRTCCPDGAYDVRAHPVGDLPPVVYGRKGGVADPPGRVFPPVRGWAERGGGVARPRRHSFRVTQPKLRHPECHHQRQTRGR